MDPHHLAGPATTDADDVDDWGNDTKLLPVYL
jgi:hypothetical protein